MRSPPEHELRRFPTLAVAGTGAPAEFSRVGRIRG